MNRISDILRQTLLGRFGLILAVMLLLSLPAAVKAGEHPRLEAVCLVAAFVQSFVFGFAVALVDFWLKGSRRWRVTVFSVLGLLMFADLWCSLLLHVRPAGYLVDLTLQTNRSEASEFFSRYVFNLPTLAILASVCLLCWAAMRYLSRLRLTMKVPPALLAGAFLALTAVNVYAFAHASKMEETRIGPRNSLQMCWKAVTERTDYADIVRRVSAALELARVDSCTFRSPLIVLVVGESHSKLHSSVYGYPLPTMPGIEAERHRGNAIVFDSARTTHTLTSQVLPRMYSTAADKDRWPDAPLFPAVFRKAGYRVALYDNQSTCYDLRGAFDIEANYFISSPEVARACLDERNDRLFDYDGDLLSAYPVLADGPSLTVYHLMGQHFQAAKRYPPSRAAFSAADYAGRTDLDAGQAAEVAHYDNATLYLDRNLCSLISSLRHRDAVLVYVSDHGEEVHDFRPRYGRAFDTPPECILDVPMLVWCSDSYLSARPDVASHLRHLSSRPFVNTDISSLLFYLAGIHMSS